MLVWSAIVGNGLLMWMGLQPEGVPALVEGLEKYLVDKHGEVVRRFVNA